jgi:hypothetical protein
MVYQAFNATPPAMTAGGPENYYNPYYKANCGCGSGWPQVTLAPAMPVGGGRREGFNANGNMGQMPQQGMQASGGAPMCTLTATAPPAGCCHPAPLHCDCCNGSGYFNASEAYGS